MIMLSNYSDAEREVLRAYHHSCTVHPTRFAVAIHHSPPRSVNPMYEIQPQTWFPVCAECHERAHSENWLVMHQLLLDSRDKFYPNVKDMYATK